MQAERERRYDLMRMPIEEGIQNQPKKKTEIKCGHAKSQIAASADYYLSINFLHRNS